jgi:uncharacterized protein YcbK (DUF882 family)
MRNLALSIAITLFFAGSAFAQNPISVTPEVLRGFSNDPQAKKAAPKPGTAAKPAAAAAAKTVPTKPAAPVSKVAAAKPPTVTKPGALRTTRYGAAPPSAASQAPLLPPDLDTTSPRGFTLVNVNTNEALTVTYWSDGAYHRDALDALNHFLRDSHDGAQTEMDPLLFDVLWHTMRLTGFTGTVEVLSAYRSPTSNAWLASVSRGVASDSQHMNGNAMDIRFAGMPVSRIRAAALSLGMGGVGFYPRSGFVHLDTGPIRYW